MNEPSSREDPRRLALSVEGVDVLPTDLDRFLVRVAGAWESGAARPEARPELVLLEGDDELRFPALPETSGAAEKAAPEAEAFRATFSVPESLEPSLAGPLRLALGEALVELPAARLPGAAPDAPAGGMVIDRAVLAERRARRAELAEEANARRAEDAEAALRDLEAELGKFEVRLERALDERAALESRLVEREREARAAAQREFAERRRREEVSEESSARVREAERAASEIRLRLREAEARATGLAGDVERLRRRAAENEHALSAAEAARARAERLAAELNEWLESVDADDAQVAAGGAVEGSRPSPAPEGGPEGPGAELPAGGQARATLRSEAALARRALATLTAGVSEPSPTPAVSPAQAEQVDRALGAVVETERRVRAIADVVARVTRDLRAEREARGRLEGELAAERAARAAAEARAESPELREFVSTAAEALRQAEDRIAESHKAAGELSGRIEQLEGDLRVERAARARPEAALEPAEATPREPPPPPDAPSPAEAWRVAEARPPAERRPAAAERPAAPAGPAPVQPWLPLALRLMVQRAPVPATRLLLELVAGQALNVSDPLEYRLRLEGEPPRSVSLQPGRARIATLGPQAAERGSFQVTTDLPGLLDLLVAGGSRKLRRRVRVAGTWRRRRALRSIPPAELRPGALAAADVWVDPLLVLRALTQLVDPDWTQGHEFVVALEVHGRGPRRLWVRAASGRPLAVLAEPPREPAPAVTAQSSHAAFQRFLGGEANGPERWTIRGDVNTLAVLTGWLERARSRS